MKWISVKDKLPEDGSSILCIIYSNNRFWIPFTTEFNDGVFWSNDLDNDRGIDPYSHLVSHWMYLPKPPKKP
jgi:hypothetical protein